MDEHCSCSGMKYRLLSCLFLRCFSATEDLISGNPVKLS